MSFYVVEVDNDGFKVYDSGGTLIDPAKDTTVAAITTELQAIQNTTGIKAIIDPLPAGTNNIGDVDLASAIPAGTNIIGQIKLVDAGNANILAVDASGRAAIQNQPNMDVALSTRATEATVATLATEAKLEAVRVLLASLDGKDFATQTTLAALLAAFNAEDFATQTTLAALLAKNTEIDNVLDTIFTRQADGNQKSQIVSPGGNPLETLTEDQTITTERGVGIFGRDGNNQVHQLVTEQTGILRVATQPAQAPAAATVYEAAVNEAELEVGQGGDVASPHTTLSAIVANGVTLYIQSIEAGTEGDSSENGSVVEVYWREGVGPTDHLIDRFYVQGQSIQVRLPDTFRARDGTTMMGDGTTTRLAIVRRRLSNAALEVDFVIRGYTI